MFHSDSCVPSAFIKMTRAMVGTVALLSVGACGTYVPQIQEVWEGPDIDGDMQFRIKENIFCETVRALRYVDENFSANGRPVIPASYGVQMQITLTAEEGGGAVPGASFNRILSNVSETFSLSAGAALSSSAARTDTTYSYYNVGKISGPGANAFCDDRGAARGSSLLLQSNLGIAAYLTGAAKGANLFPSSAPPKAGGVKLDVFSYDVKFVVVTSGSISPSWQLVNLSTSRAAQALLSAGRTRTHGLTLTFGPGDPSTPSLAALQTHFSSQIVQSNQRFRP